LNVALGYKTHNQVYFRLSDYEGSCFGLTMIIAWRILHVVTLGQQCPDLPCDVVFDPEEWQAAWIIKHRSTPPQKQPHHSTL
jgi:hypothetical protein